MKGNKREIREKRTAELGGRRGGEGEEMGGEGRWCDDILGFVG